MDVGWLHPTVTNDGQLSGAPLYRFGTVMVLEPVVDGKPAPGNPLRIGLLVRKQAAFAAVRLKGIVLADDHLLLSVSVQVCN